MIFSSFLLFQKQYFLNNNFWLQQNTGIKIPSKSNKNEESHSQPKPKFNYFESQLEKEETKDRVKENKKNNYLPKDSLSFPQIHEETK